MVSATMPDSLDEFARAGLRDFMFAKLDYEYSLSPKLQLHSIFMRTEQKVPFLIELLQIVESINLPTIVFVSSRYWVEYL